MNLYRGCNHGCIYCDSRSECYRNDDFARIIEPHAPSSTKRFEALRELADAGIYCGVLFTPTLPFITDNEENIRALVASAARSGACFIYHMEGVTMRDRQRDFFYEKVTTFDKTLPETYRQTFGNRYMCTSPHAKKNRALFQSLCKDYGLTYRMSDIIKAYKREIPEPQMSLF